MTLTAKQAALLARYADAVRKYQAAKAVFEPLFAEHDAQQNQYQMRITPSRELTNATKAMYEWAELVQILSDQMLQEG